MYVYTCTCVRMYVYTIHTYMYVYSTCVQYIHYTHTCMYTHVYVYRYIESGVQEARLVNHCLLNSTCVDKTKKLAYPRLPKIHIHT